VRRFEFVGGTSSKFWEVSQSETRVTVRFGRIGGDGQTQTKDYGTWDEAAERVRKLIAEKLREGYVEVEGSGPRPETEPGFRRPPTFPPYEPPALPPDGPIAVGSVRLPAGRRLQGDPQYAARGSTPVTQPVVWATDQPIPQAGRAVYWLRSTANALNLVPVLLAAMDGEPSRPWDSREFSPADPRRASVLDPAAELAKAWSETFDQEDEESVVPLTPFGKKFPGLAQPPALASELRDDGDLLEQMAERRVALVAATRAADVVIALGWMGAVNVHDDPALISAVLRSWEVRWGARLVELGFDTLKLTVAVPPPDEKSALAIAAEHFALCPDNIWQGAETIAAYAQSLVGARTWEFWWD